MHPVIPTPSPIFSFLPFSLKVLEDLLRALSKNESAGLSNKCSETAEIFQELPLSISFNCGVSHWSFNNMPSHFAKLRCIARCAQ